MKNNVGSASGTRQRTFIGRAARHTLLFILYALAGALIAGFAGFIWLGVSGKPELKPWHTAKLNEEFTRAASERVNSLAAYSQLEQRLFDELKGEVYERIPEADKRSFSRYFAGSRADPAALPDNANRTFELESPAPRAGVILIHGLTDSPYMFRALAQRLHARGCTVVAFRLPAHGTAPAALKDVDWRDWAAAVRVAARDMRRRLPAEAPLHMVGFSTGAALAVEYSLARLEGEDLPSVERLVLLSPAIGVDPLAFLAIWQERLSRLPGLGKMAWLDLIPEYDPYKYNSFPVNAGHQIYTLTRVIDERLTRLSQEGGVKAFPRTLVYQSVADATVSPLAVVQVFLGRLAAEGHQLVVYDINRRADAEPLLRPGARLPVERLQTGAARPFGVTVITNQDDASAALVALHRPSGGVLDAPVPLGMDWPRGVFSLSHTALPISPDDAVYGAERPAEPRQIYLGKPELFGEINLLAMPPKSLIRLRFNPFYEWQTRGVERFLGVPEETG